ncbi:MAG: hypothetical protein MJZ23_02550 [Paludibacteraceae bacterium]|nr:hypothetical protein [Paludibacteraceae bacterium]
MNENAALIEELIKAICDGTIDSKWSLIKMKAVDSGVSEIQSIRTLIETIATSLKNGNFDSKIDVLKLQAADAGIDQSKLAQIIAAIKVKIGNTKEEATPTAAEVSKERKETNTEKPQEKLKSDVGIISQLLKNKLFITLVLIFAIVCPFFTDYSFLYKFFIAIGGAILYTIGIISILYVKPTALKIYLIVYAILMVVLAVAGNII